VISIVSIGFPFPFDKLLGKDKRGGGLECHRDVKGGSKSMGDGGVKREGKSEPFITLIQKG
jgi:hypothetical protein